MKTHQIILLTILFPLLSFTQVYNLTDLGAKGDGVTDNTKIIQEAIDKCSQTGGKVYFPTGEFATGTIYLKSNVTIEISPKAIWTAVLDSSIYKNASMEYMHESNAVFIYAEGQENIKIMGEGTIYPKGDDHEVFPRRGRGIRKRRPYGVYLRDCKNVSLHDVYFTNSAFWMIRLLNCDDVEVRGIKIYNHANGNNDGIDIVDCHRVVVSNCIIDSSDDGLCFKSESNRGCEDFTITNCVISSFASAIKWGTASYTGYKRFTISNCVIKPSRSKVMHHPHEAWGGLAGLDLLSVDGGVLEDINISNIVMDSIETPIFIRLGERKRTWCRDYIKDTANRPDGIVRNINISNITVRNGGIISSSISAYPGTYVENITLSNIDLHLQGTGTLEDTTLMVNENSTAYPFNRMYKSNLPSYGLYLRHVKNIKIDGLQIRTENPDPRYDMVFEDVIDAKIDNIRVQHPEHDSPQIKVLESENITLEGEEL